MSVFRLIHVKTKVLALCLPDLKKLFSQICFGKNGQRLFVFINEKELESLGVAYATSLLKKNKATARGMFSEGCFYYSSLLSSQLNCSRNTENIARTW